MQQSFATKTFLLTKFVYIRYIYYVGTLYKEFIAYMQQYTRVTARMYIHIVRCFEKSLDLDLTHRYVGWVLMLKHSPEKVPACSRN